LRPFRLGPELQVSLFRPRQMEVLHAHVNPIVPQRCGIIPGTACMVTADGAAEGVPSLVSDAIE
jgi:hypothetical protein